MNLSVIIPVLNEEKALPLVLRDLKKALASIPIVTMCDIIVADNGSTDRSAEASQREGGRVVAAPRRGYGSACLAGLAAMSPDTDVIVFMDGDHSDFAEDLPALLEPIQNEEADLVLGARVRAEPGALAPHQRFGNALACRLMRIFYGRSYRDLGPFRAIRREALDQLEMRDPAYGWTVEMQIKAARQGLRILEVPVRYRARIGQSKISGTLAGSWRAGWAILRTLVKYASCGPSSFL